LRDGFNAKAEGAPANWQAIVLTLRLSLAGGTAREGGVLFDDLYAGPQSSNPNRDPSLTTR
jgi:hypothetical protein